MSIESATAAAGGYNVCDWHQTNQQDAPAAKTSTASRRSAASEVPPAASDAGPGLRERPASRDIWRGMNYREQAGASVDTRSGDVRVSREQEASRRTGDADVSVSRDTTRAVNVRTGNTMQAANERVSVQTPDARYERDTQYREATHCRQHGAGGRRAAA
jgi:hypothetical protein